MEECSICQENMLITQNIMTLRVCSHKFHTTCIEPWARVSNTCPLCRKVFKKKEEDTQFITVIGIICLVYFYKYIYTYIYTYLFRPRV